MLLNKVNYLVDYHMHTDNSLDASFTIEEMCRSAIKNHIDEIAITDHFEPMPGDENCVSYTQNKYFHEMTAARLKFGKQLELKLAVEIGQPQYFEKETKEMLNKINYDFVLASAHKIIDGTDMSEIQYENMTKEETLEMYLQELHNLVDGFDDFDCIGHLDLIKRYSCQIYNENISLMDSRKNLVSLLKKLIKKGKGIEINASGLRQTTGETFPGFDVIKIYKELGGKILTIGSDAHNPEDLGKGIHHAYEMASAAGFKYITVFTNRQPEFIKIAGENVKVGA